MPQESTSYWKNAIGYGIYHGIADKNIVMDESLRWPTKHIFYMWEAQTFSGYGIGWWWWPEIWL